MLDRTIPFCNTIMKCSAYTYKEVELPEGFSIDSYQPGYEKGWAKLEYAIGDFGSVTEAEKWSGKGAHYCCYEYLCRVPGFSCLYPHTAMELESNTFV